jgi:hypothetical protein
VAAGQAKKGDLVLYAGGSKGDSLTAEEHEDERRREAPPPTNTGILHAVVLIYEGEEKG